MAGVQPVSRVRRAWLPTITGVSTGRMRAGSIATSTGTRIRARKPSSSACTDTARPEQTL